MTARTGQLGKDKRERRTEAGKDARSGQSAQLGLNNWYKTTGTGKS
jgi:hypothetical protein